MKTLLTIVHLLGVVTGAGGAYLSDAMFFSTVKDEKVSKTELRFLKIGSRFVWFGLTLLIISGIGIFLTDTETYLNSSKFLTKMTIVGVILLNGIVFHMSHLPRIERHVGHHFPSSDEFMRHRPLLLASGALSFVSWTSAIILGSLKILPYSYSSIMIVYLSVIIVAIISTQILFRHR